MKNNTLEGIFRQKLEDLRVEPSAQARDLVYQKIRKRGRIILYRRLSIAAGIILVFSAGFFYLGPADRKDTVVQEESSAADPGAVNEKHESFISGNEIEEKIPEAEIPGINETAATEVNRDQENGYVSSREDKRAGEISVNHTDRETMVPAGENGMEIVESVRSAGESATEPIQVIPEELPVAADPIAEVKAADPKPEPARHGTGVEPVKITIEYIASGSGKSRNSSGQNSVRELYSKMNPEAVIGDLRTLKDQLFALEFINKRTDENLTEK